jgi:alpha-N-arabinofuranosidase
MRRRNTLFLAFLGMLSLLALLPASHAQAQSDQSVYADALANGWENWSWCTTDFNATAPVHSGAHSVKVTYTAAWQGFYLHHAAFDTTSYTSLTFWINGDTTNGRNITVAGLLSDQAQPAVNLNTYIAGGSVAAGTWRKVTIPLSDLHVDNHANMTGFWLQENSGAAQPAFYVDDIALTAVPAPSQVNLSINVGQVVRTVDSRLFGVNAAVWDGAVNTPATISLLNAIDNRVMRFPGGSLSDDYHWKTNTTDSNTWTWATSFDAFANVARSANAQVFITANYGNGTSQEAADWVTYSNVTKGYGFKYWEIGNENYGSWETDIQTRPHDPYTYATRAKDYITKMKAADATIKVGVVVVTGEDSYANYTDHPATNPRTGLIHNGWTPVLLTTLRSLGVTPDFIIFHRYEQGPGGESDAVLLQAAKTWKNDAADLRQQLTDYLGAAGANVELVCTENNSVYSNPGKQTTSLVNGLYLADSLGALLQTEFNTMIWWDLRNGQETGNNNSASLYGWRQYGDYGVMSGQNDLYPTYYTFKLLSHFARGGDKIVSATSDYGLLTPYAAKRADGTLSLLVINKSATSTFTGNIALTGFTPKASATVFSYGIPQDNAARTGTGSPDVAQTTLSNAAGTFTASFAPYSATILSLAPALASQTLNPGADAYVQAGSNANTNYGAQTLLVVKRVTNDSTHSLNRCSYLKFDLTGVTATPTSATLTLTVDTSSNPTNKSETVKVYSIADTTWTETGITWNNAPGLNRANFSSAGTFLTSKVVPLLPGTATFDLTSFVAANKGRVVTLQLMDEVTDNLYLAFKSREATSGKPTLTLTF